MNHFPFYGPDAGHLLILGAPRAGKTVQPAFPLPQHFPAAINDDAPAGQSDEAGQ